MTCESSNPPRIRYIPKNLGGSLAPTGLTTQDEIDKKRACLEEAILLLRKAGFPVDFCTDVGRVRIITEEWDISHVNGELSFIIEGYEVGKHFLNIQTSLGFTGFPHIATGIMRPSKEKMTNDNMGSK